MYGTVARIQINPGTEAQLREMQEKYNSVAVPGFVAQHLYKMNKEANVFYLAVVFESKEAYTTPEQDTRYREFRALLATDPEWHDSEIVYEWHS